MPSPSLNYFYGGASPGLRVQKLLDACVCSEGYVSYTDSDRRFVAAYIHEKLISGEIGDRRSLKIVQTLCRFRLYLECEYKNCTILDYKNAIGNLFSKGSFKTKESLSSHAIADYVTITKGFFRWMIDNESAAITESQLQKIKVPKRTKKQLLKPSDLLTPDEIITFLECCSNSRDRALFSLMYEGGFRIGEIGTLRWGDLNFDKYGIQIFIDNSPPDITEETIPD
ncbi:MAG: tyrosine-type recombinase/integrase [Methanospirillaceae archaeon]|nr:tyrosine-type recombinase/integrase [Methanospirillaceae archaeon]